MLKPLNLKSKTQHHTTGHKTRVCTICSTELDISRFEISKGYRARQCRSCRQSRKRENISKTPHAYLSHLYGQLAHRRKKTHDFDIVRKDLHKLYDEQKGICQYSGVKMTYIKDGTGYHLSNISIDRIDNTKGYVKGNIALVCLAVNMMKYTLELDELIKWCKNIANSN